MSRILWNPKVHRRIHNSPPVIPLPCQLNSVLALPLHFCNIHFNVILTLMSMHSNFFLPFGFLHQHPVSTSLLLHACHMPRPSHQPQFDHPHNIWRAVPIMKLPTRQFQVPLYPVCLRQNISLSTLFSNALSQRSSLNMTDPFYSHMKQIKLLFI